MGEDQATTVDALPPADGRWLLHAGHLGLFNFIASLAWLAAVLVVYSNVNVALDDFFALALAGFVLFISWAIGSIGLFRWESGQPPTRSWRGIGIAGMLALPLSVGLWLGLTAADAPFRVRFSLSEDSLSSYAQEFRSRNIHDDADSHRVGLFNVRFVRANDGCIELVTFQGVLSRTSGLAQGTRLQCRPPRYDHLAGDWWTWHRSSD